MSPLRNDDISSIIQTMISPLITQLQGVDAKLDQLALKMQHHATREEVESLRKECMGTLVSRDAYEPRHLSLIERDAQIEESVRETRRDMLDSFKEIEAKHQADMQKIEDRIQRQEESVNDTLSAQQEMRLSGTDRTWLRISQALGILSAAVVALEWLLSHLRLN